jgi:hypothetical protein
MSKGKVCIGWWIVWLTAGVLAAVTGLLWQSEQDVAYHKQLSSLRLKSLRYYRQQYEHRGMVMTNCGLYVDNNASMIGE